MKNTGLIWGKKLAGNAGSFDKWQRYVRGIKPGTPILDTKNKL